MIAFSEVKWTMTRLDQDQGPSWCVDADIDGHYVAIFVDDSTEQDDGYVTAWAEIQDKDYKAIAGISDMMEPGGRVGAMRTASAIEMAKRMAIIHLNGLFAMGIIKEITDGD